MSLTLRLTLTPWPQVYHCPGLPAEFQCCSVSSSSRGLPSQEASLLVVLRAVETVCYSIW